MVCARIFPEPEHMNLRLTALELRLALWLPCTTATVAAWYSRVWRTPEQRVQTLVWAVLIVVALGALVWLAPPSSRPPSARWAVPGDVQAWLGGLVVMIGIRAGHSARRQVLAWLERHWLAWCLCRRQIRNEIIVCGIWRAEAAVLKLLVLCVLIAQWVAISISDIALLAELFFGGFALAFAFSRPRRRHHPAPRRRANPSIRRLPAIVCLQALRPRAWLICAGMAALAVSAIAGYAVQVETPHLLTAASVTAAGAFVYGQIRLAPGLAALYRLLAWTGTSLWRCLARVLMLPIGLAAVLMLPIAIAALMLGRPLWVALAGLGVLAAAWAALVRVLGDLARMRRGRNEAFVLIHSLIPVALLMSLGPEESIALIGLHLGWLLWRAQRLWHDGRGNRRA